jgi:hypothetical protein
MVCDNSLFFYLFIIIYLFLYKFVWGCTDYLCSNHNLINSQVIFEPHNSQNLNQMGFGCDGQNMKCALFFKINVDRLISTSSKHFVGHPTLASKKKCSKMSKIWNSFELKTKQSIFFKRVEEYVFFSGFGKISVKNTKNSAKFAFFQVFYWKLWK